MSHKATKKGRVVVVVVVVVVEVLLLVLTVESSSGSGDTGTRIEAVATPFQTKPRNSSGWLVRFNHKEEQSESA